jgi:hypothetical protein
MRRIRAGCCARAASGNAAAALRPRRWRRRVSDKAGHDVLGISLCCHQDNGHEWKRSVAFQASANLDTVEFPHHDIEQNEVWKQRFRCIESLLAIGSVAQVITLGRESRRKDVAVVSWSSTIRMRGGSCMTRPRSEFSVHIHEFWRAVPLSLKALPYRRRSRRRAPWPRRRSMHRR